MPFRIPHFNTVVSGHIPASIRPSLEEKGLVKAKHQEGPGPYQSNVHGPDVKKFGPLKFSAGRKDNQGAEVNNAGVEPGRNHETAAITTADDNCTVPKHHPMRYSAMWWKMRDWDPEHDATATNKRSGASSSQETKNPGAANSSSTQEILIQKDNRQPGTERDNRTRRQQEPKPQSLSWWRKRDFDPVYQGGPNNSSASSSEPTKQPGATNPNSMQQIMIQKGDKQLGAEHIYSPGAEFINSELTLNQQRAEKVVKWADEYAGNRGKEVKPLQKNAIHQFVEQANRDFETFDEFRQAVHQTLLSNTRQTIDGAGALVKTKFWPTKVANHDHNYLHLVMMNASDRSGPGSKTGQANDMKEHFKILLEMGVDPTQQSSAETGSKNPLHMAAETGCDELLEVCAEIRGSDKKGEKEQHMKASIKEAAMQYDAANKTPAHYVNTEKRAKLMVACGTNVNQFDIKRKARPVVCSIPNQEVGHVWLKEGRAKAMHELDFDDISGDSYLAEGWAETSEAVKFLCNEMNENPTASGIFNGTAVRNAPNGEVAKAVVVEIRAHEERINNPGVLSVMLEACPGNPGAPAVVVAKDIKIMQVYLDAGAQVTTRTIQQFKDTRTREGFADYDAALALLESHKS